MVQFRRQSYDIPVYTPREGSYCLSPLSSPLAVSPPCSPYRDTSKSKSAISVFSSITKNWKALPLVAMAIIILFGPSARCRTLGREVSRMQENIRSLAVSHEESVMSLSEAASQARILEGGIESLDLQNKEMARMIHEKLSNDTVVEEEKSLSDEVKLLQTAIQDISRMEAIERFGEGPHRVQFTLRFMNDKGAFIKEPRNSRTNKFVIELAPLSHMPHSGLHFLHMIDHRLWNGAAFVHHVDHVVQAVPTSFRTATSMRDKFEKADLTTLAFQEYHEDYPHDEYTVGFSGRPGGLEFYINTKDNAELHGPGGQKQHDLHEESDPCFAKVISGHRVVDKMQQKNVQNKKEINIVGIESAVLV